MSSSGSFRGMLGAARDHSFSFLKQHGPLLVGLAVLYIFFSVMHERFSAERNLKNILEQITINALLASGMTFVILLRGIDLSVGSTLAFAEMTAVFVAVHTGSFLAGALGGLGAGAAVGCLNGALVAFGRLPPFIVTLATMSIARGLAFMYTLENWGEPLSIPEDQAFFRSLARYQIPCLLAAFVACGFLLRRTRFGHYVYAIGGSREAARFTGLPIRRVEFSVYLLSGLLAGVAGIIQASLLWAANPNDGQMFELRAIAAAVIGGASFTGGVGTLTGTALGAVIMGVLGNGMNLLGYHFSVQHLVTGVVIVLAVSLDVLRRRGREE